MNTYVFFHVGEDCWQPQLLVRSINACDPSAEVIQVSDEVTPSIPGIARRHTLRVDRYELMSMRLDGFAGLKLGYPAIYLDTDMILLHHCDSKQIIGDKEIVMCRRSFNKESIFNHSFRGMNLSEYKGMKLDDVYPYLACATVTQSSDVWESLAAILEGLDPKYRVWYGDQEALKIFKTRRPLSCGSFLENTYGCIPENLTEYPSARIVHFKGAARKIQMQEFFRARFKSLQQ